MNEACLHCGAPIRAFGDEWVHVGSGLLTCRRSKSNQHDGIYRAQPATVESIANDAATRMREACVEKVKAMRSEWAGNEVWIDAADEIITAISSLTLDQVEKKR